MKFNIIISIILLSLTQNLYTMNKGKIHPLTHDAMLTICDEEIAKKQKYLTSLDTPKNILLINLLHSRDATKSTIKDYKAITHREIQVLNKNKASITKLKLKKLKLKDKSLQQKNFCAIS